MTGAWIASAAAVLACVAACALIAARARVSAIAAFALVGVMGATAQIAIGGPEAGFALIGVTALLALMAYATGALTGDALDQKQRPPRGALAVSAITLCALVAAWPLAPAALTHAAALQTLPAFATARGEDLVLALAALIGVAAAAAALLGFGERGVIGMAREGRR